MEATGEISEIPSLQQFKSEEVEKSKQSLKTE